MKRFMVVSGFLGAGKTTTMLALAKYMSDHDVNTKIIANDLGARNIVDAKFTELNGGEVTAMTGECICYQTENLVDKLRRFFDYEQADFVMSDIPGCGIGALEHVYYKLDDEYHNEFELAPFMVVTDPVRLRAIMLEHADLNLPEEMNFLFRAQLKEADAVVLNKADLLTVAEVEDFKGFLADFCPGIPVFVISAKDGTGIKELAEHLLTEKARLERFDIGYGSPEFIAAEQKLCWYNRQFYVNNDKGFDGNGFAVDMLNAIRDELKNIARNVPHLKLFAETENGDVCKMSLLGVDYDIEQDRLLKSGCKSLSVILNVRAVCESQTLSNIMDMVLAQMIEKYNFICNIFFTESFGMMDEGRM